MHFLVKNAPEFIEPSGHFAFYEIMFWNKIGMKWFYDFERKKICSKKFHYFKKIKILEKSFYKIPFQKFHRIFLHILSIFLFWEKKIAFLVSLAGEYILTRSWILPPSHNYMCEFLSPQGEFFAGTSGASFCLSVAHSLMLPYIY